ncbi:hypothetical protein L202_06123 [Cryptococcus amylolentus CBS 6039]|uniref:Uncharacterized protein n=2 Tax=Cryptococcus amylolentus TaxID=104669 RepID=A0A1E3HIL9_9TREE|nr:hypothetical protein L202_06123 [Cryptococcus amylolentus CBS 6039]ODN76202.1 hypothetical protein L202_06123 [Cryptococcus amylolentus CBS 6039]ODN96316.1 hypothetical protein I350_08338 [Cryptococcus amylolentus CBS 6273]
MPPSGPSRSTKIPECLIPTYSGRNENPYRHHFELRTADPMAIMPLLYWAFAAFIVFLTAFAGVTLQAVLEYLFGIAGIERLVEDQELLRKQQDERDKANPPSYLKDANIGKIYRHQLDGECYQQGGATADVHQRGCLVLTITIHIDWADPSKFRNHSPRSMGPILCQLADLPNQYRSGSTFAMLMGITPAPNEPPGCLLQRLLLALGVNILTGACDGIWIRTPAHPNGRKTSYQTHISRRAGRISQATQVYLEGVEKSVFKVPGQLSISDLFPGFDKIRHAVADPMHAILEGVLPYYIRRVHIMGSNVGLHSVALPIISHLPGQGFFGAW